MSKRITLAVCSLAVLGPAFAQQLTPERAQRLGQAYGALLGYTWTMKYVSDTCGGEAKDLPAVWKERNAKQLAQGEAILHAMMAQMAAQYGQKAAADVESQLRQQMDQFGQTRATGNLGKLASMPLDQKAFVCKKWVASVRAGQWDVEKQSPELNKFLASEAR